MGLAAGFVFLISASLSFGNLFNCPDKASFKPCSCDYEGINCNMVTSDEELEKAFSISPNGNDKRFRGFWMFNTPVEKIPALTFQNYAFHTMTMDNNQINYIGENAFIGSAHTLVILSLNDNQLTEIPLSAMNRLGSLAQLRLANNKIESIPDDAFKGFPILAAIILNNNRISKIGEKAFSRQSNLFELNLSNNLLTYLGDYTFHNPNRNAFRIVNLSANKISDLSEKTFEGTANMGFFIASANSLESLQESKFRSLLDIMKNNPAAQFVVSGNPIKCDMRLMWLLGYNKNTKSRVAGLMCNKKRLSEMDIFDLENEKL